MICLIGNKGRIGRRYEAIMKYRTYDYVGIDIGDSIPEADQYIVATPTKTHYELCKKLMETGKPILCEKPLTTEIKECHVLRDYEHGFVVNQYNYLTNLFLKPHSLTYDYYCTGEDGLLWDCCQILFIDPEAKLGDKSPFWTFAINGQLIEYAAIEHAYISMIDDFVHMKKKNLWDFEIGYEMTKVVLERMEQKPVS